jgi:ubiquitin thioesterase OTU1
MKDNDFSLVLNFEGRKFEIFLDHNKKLPELVNIIKKIILRKCLSKFNSYNLLDIKEKNIEIRKNSEPQVVSLINNYDQTLKDLKFNNGEDIKISSVEDCVLQENTLEKAEFKVDFSKYSVHKITIPGDNSCLFNAINYALNKCLTEPQILRELVSSEIKKHQEIYNKVVLEAEPSEYCDWIMRSDTWGGGIELSILAKFFKLRFDLLDIQNNTIERIGDVRYLYYFCT